MVRVAGAMKTIGEGLGLTLSSTSGKSLAAWHVNATVYGPGAMIVR